MHHPCVTTYCTAQNEADASLRGLDAALRNVSVDTLESICGDGDFQSIEVLTEYILGILVRLVEAALGVLEVLSCETIVPLYVSEVSQRFCHDRVRFSHSHSRYALYLSFRQLPFTVARASIQYRVSLGRLHHSS